MEKEGILIVHDDKRVCDILSQYLSNDYKVAIAQSFEQSATIFEGSPFNIVITELESPKGPSIEVLNKFKELKSDLEIIVIASYSSIPLAIKAMKAGAYGYITKPFNPDELKLVVFHALERQKLLEEVKEKEIYKERALLDGLTQIYNRGYFEEILCREVNRAMRYPQAFSLLMVDVDDFKKFNDTYGHVAGDKVLKGVARILVRSSRITDFVARYGGEEFVVITPYTDKKNASVLAARIMDSVAQEKFILDSSTMPHVTASIGVATFGEDATTGEEMVKKADLALYEAKKLGKNRVCLFGIGMPGSKEKRQMTESKE